MARRKNGRGPRQVTFLVEIGEKLSPKDFTIRAIEASQLGPGRYIHVVYSGFNDAFRAYFPDLDPVTTMTQLAKDGAIRLLPKTGGALISTIPNGEIIRSSGAGAKVLEKMGFQKTG